MELLEFVLIGLGLGAAYGLLALPISLVSATTGVLDAATGGYAVLAGMVAAQFGNHVLGLAAGIAMGVAAAVVTALVYLALLRRGQSDHMTIVLATVGLLFACSSFAQWRFGIDGVFIRLTDTTWSIDTMSVRLQIVINLVIAGLLLVAVQAFLHRTDLGRDLRAAATNLRDAELVGIPVHRLQFLIIAVGGGVAGFAGVLITSTSGTQFSNALPLTFSAIGAVLIFGNRGPATAVAGGLVLGVVEALATGYLSSTIAPVVPLAFILAVLAAGKFDIDGKALRA